ncbi:hypothetical protein EE612_005047 [Oryza sativa]|nr:hypothetical protein EE612_005047 [Oryza sativa]
MDREEVVCCYISLLINRLTDDIHNTPKCGPTNRNSDGRAGVEHALAANEPLGPVHGDGAHHVLPEMLRHLEHEADVVVEHLQRGQDRGQALVEPHVHDGANHLAHLPDGASARELIGDLAAPGGLARRGGRRGGRLRRGG